ncbi:type IV pilus biogenesis protein PilP [Pseudomonas fluorescens]|uniref:Type IV pilus biogenesis protein PilP n=1 Tax=Pseudomonas fluorescens TaxID=294 RepID=A0A2T0HN00_PSEFL|nr:type IV pilus biogenesis protein PilP [Pseudomonas fluorescens]PRW84474.1 type IV pilus biogenesis protein PilP [Pseudomonas fluorescens]
MRVKTLSLLALMLSACAVSAAERSQPTVGDLSAIQSETIMYKAQSARAEAKGEMQSFITKAGDDPLLTQMNSAPSVVTADLPTVTGISGAAGRLFATFRYSNGTTVSAKSGDRITGGFTVSEVGLDRVVLTLGDRRIPLQFGVINTPAPTTGGQMTGPMQMPGFNMPSTVQPR